MVYVFLLFFFFFFKQKTAYEIVSGDWSSDVCSSDLDLHGGINLPPGPGVDGAKSGIWRREMAIATVNPATGQVVKTFESLSDAQLEVKLQKAADTFLSYRKTPFAERSRLMIDRK